MISMRAEPLGQFAAAMLVEVKADNDVLKELAERIGTGSSGLKGLSAWVAEKVSRLKLKRDASDGLGTFEALEFLALGIQGKLAPRWKNTGLKLRAWSSVPRKLT